MIVSIFKTIELPDEDAQDLIVELSCDVSNDRRGYDDFDNETEITFSDITHDKLDYSDYEILIIEEYIAFNEEELHGEFYEQYLKEI